MRRSHNLVVVLMVLTAGTAIAADLPNSKDHPLLGRVKGTEIVAYDVKRFDSVAFQTSSFKKGASTGNEFAQPPLVVEGARTRIWYEGPGMSSLEIIRQYQAIEGFEILWDSSNDSKDSDYRGYNLNYLTQNVPRSKFDWNVAGWAFTVQAKRPTIRTTTLKRSAADGELYVSIVAVESTAKPSAKVIEGAYAAVDVIDAAAMKKDMVVVSASEMEKTIAETGRISLYGIHFDTNKSAVKPESKGTLEQIAALLKKDSTLKLNVIGHTDNVGGAESNLTLSKRRADAVMIALIEDYGIDGVRLEASGAGMTAPVADNATEEGRAKNRRVELVKR